MAKLPGSPAYESDPPRVGEDPRVRLSKAWYNTSESVREHYE
jgi:hypothetical protein